ncbi:MAG: hypothetical protein FJY67_09225 [Calditrichaeota bacterium]|nr:hypothetical protein [Calditrichota bacterium]
MSRLGSHLIVSVAFAILALATGAVAEDSLDVVLRVIDLYDAGRISEAEYLALKALDVPGELTPAQRTDLYKVLAFCAAANDDELNGARYFLQALRLTPTLSPDPITWSPKVRRIFDIARTDYVKVAAEEHRFRVAAEAEICRKASLRALYIPGGGQFEKGEPGRGLIYTGLIATTAILLAYAELQMPDARQNYLDATTSRDAARLWKDYRSLSRLRNGAAIGLGISYGAAFLDALWRKPPPGRLPVDGH